MFPCARFLHLVRHPRSQCESLIEYLSRRTKRRAGRAQTDDEEAPFPMADDPQNFWFLVNDNISRFLASIPAAQQRRIQGETLLADPDTHLREIAEWLGVRTDDEAMAAMKRPEKSPYACFGPPNARGGNDISFLENPVLRPYQSEPRSLEGPLSWRTDGRGFLPRVKRLAEQFGYV
jgi:hypothetical protein